MMDRVFLATTGNSLARAARESTGVWQTTFALEERGIQYLEADPLDSSVVYAGTQGQGVLRSEDRGQSWRQAGLEGQDVRSLAASPHSAGTLYAGVRPAAMYVSHDGGNHWEQLQGFQRIRGRRFWRSPAGAPFTAYVLGIGLSPEDPQRIVAGIEFGAVVVSEDGGQTWSGHRKGALRDCHTLTFHTTNGSWVYEAGGTGGGVAVSRDGGRSWKQPKEGLDRHYGWACAADPERPEIWYASLSPPGSFPSMAPAAHIDGKANAHIFRSSGGAAWEKLSGGLPDPLNYMAYALVTDPGAPGHLYAGLSDGDVWHTADYGDSWQKLPLNLRGIHRSMIII